MSLTEQCDTLMRLIGHGVEALRDGDGDAKTAAATLANLGQLDKRVRQHAGAVDALAEALAVLTDPERPDRAARNEAVRIIEAHSDAAPGGG
jgi:predicted transposase YbfD/YdcC